MKVACDKALRYWKAYIGDKFVTDVGDLSGYIKWRRDYWKNNDRGKYKTRKKEPADRTIVLEIQTIKRVFSFAVSRGYIPKMIVVPTLSKVNKNKRPAVPMKEQIKLKNHLLGGGWIPRANANNDYLDAHKAMLRAFILTLLLSGIRVGEARNLKWRDIEEVNYKDRVVLLLKVEGKTEQHEAVTRPILHRYLLRYRRWLEISGFYKGDDSYVFLDRYGKQIGDLRESFQKICKNAGIPRYALYSLRHSFITNYLKYSKQPDIYLLADSCGTSVEMIQNFYGHVRTRDAIHRLLN